MIIKGSPYDYVSHCDDYLNRECFFIWDASVFQAVDMFVI